MYQDAMRALQLTFGQLHALLSVHLDKLSQLVASEKQNIEKITSYSVKFS